MTEKLISLIKALGVSDDTLKSITEETTNEQLQEIAETFAENQKALYKGKDVDVDGIKKGAIAEGKRKTRKAIREALGLTAELTNAQIDEMDDAGFSNFIKEKSQANATQEVTTLRTQLTQLGQQVEQLSEEKEQVVNTIKSEYENKINSIYVNSELSKKLSSLEFIVPSDEVLTILEAKLLKKGVQLKKGEKEIELLNANNERLQKVNDKGTPVGFHTLDTFIEAELDPYRKKNNGNDNKNPNHNPIDTSKLNKEQIEMQKHLEYLRQQQEN